MAPMTCCFSALSVARYSLKLFRLVLWPRVIAEIWAAVAFGAMTGMAPGLAGGTNAMLDSMLYSAGVTVRYSNPSSPSPRLDWAEAALAFSCKLRLSIVS